MFYGHADRRLARRMYVCDTRVRAFHNKLPGTS